MLISQDRHRSYIFPNVKGTCFFNSAMQIITSLDHIRNWATDPKIVKEICDLTPNKMIDITHKIDYKNNLTKIADSEKDEINSQIYILRLCILEIMQLYCINFNDQIRDKIKKLNTWRTNLKSKSSKDFPTYDKNEIFYSFDNNVIDLPNDKALVLDDNYINNWIGSSPLYNNIKDLENEFYFAICLRFDRLVTKIYTTKNLLFSKVLQDDDIGYDLVDEVLILLLINFNINNRDLWKSNIKNQKYKGPFTFPYFIHKMKEPFYYANHEFFRKMMTIGTPLPTHYSDNFDLFNFEKELKYFKRSQDQNFNVENPDLKSQYETTKEFIFEFLISQNLDLSKGIYNFSDHYLNFIKSSSYIKVGNSEYYDGYKKITKFPQKYFLVKISHVIGSEINNIKITDLFKTGNETFKLIGIGMKVPGHGYSLIYVDKDKSWYEYNDSHGSHFNYLNNVEDWKTNQKHFKFSENFFQNKMIPEGIVNLKLSTYNEKKKEVDLILNFNNFKVPIKKNDPKWNTSEITKEKPYFFDNSNTFIPLQQPRKIPFPDDGYFIKKQEGFPCSILLYEKTNDTNLQEKTLFKIIDESTTNNFKSDTTLVLPLNPPQSQPQPPQPQPPIVPQPIVPQPIEQQPYILVPNVETRYKVNFTNCKNLS